jgi:hypothetical protein
MSGQDEAPRIVRVTWLDTGAHVDYGWAKKEKYMENLNKDQMLVQTVGMVIDEDDDIILVGLSYEPVGRQWYGGQAIHKSAIKRVEWLQP